MVSSQVMHIIGMNVIKNIMINCIPYIHGKDFFYFLVFKRMQYVFQVNYLSIIVYFKTNIILSLKNKNININRQSVYCLFKTIYFFLCCLINRLNTIFLNEQRTIEKIYIICSKLFLELNSKVKEIIIKYILKHYI